MMTLTATPKTIQAGDSISWLIAHPEYPASAGWSLSYVLVNASAKITLTSSADGDSHLVSATPETTAAYAAGTYAYVGQVSDGTDRITVERGSIEIMADYAASEAFDTRSWVDVAIDALEAAIAGRAGKTQLSQTLPNGVQVQHLSLSEQISALKELKTMRASGKGRWRKTILPRFFN